jgi:hypothetical protein
VAETPEQAPARSLNDVIARVAARAVSAAGLRPCYKYSARFPERTFGGLGQQLCFTDSLFRSAPVARQFLALPYEPVCRLAVSNARWEQFEGNDTTRRRAWAAFGQPGGAFEMVSSARFQELELRGVASAQSPPGTESWLLEEMLPTGGSADEYCSIRHGAEHGSLVDLVQIIRATAAEFAGSMRETEAFADSKIIDDSVAAGVVYWKREQHEYTLSVTARVHGGYLSGLKFWAAFWTEDERIGVRHVYKPIELIAPGVIVARIDEFAPYSTQSGVLMTVLWEQFDALKRILMQKIAADCSSEAIRHTLLP